MKKDYGRTAHSKLVNRRLAQFWWPPSNGRKALKRAGQPAASPVLVAALTDMGFPRERVERALRQTNNDVDQATNLLLGGM